MSWNVVVLDLQYVGFLSVIHVSIILGIEGQEFDHVDIILHRLDPDL